MIVAITGASGFVGRRVVARFLAAGHHVRVLSRKGLGNLAEVEVHRGTLGADPPEAFEKFVDGADVVMHCAGEIRDITQMHAVHVDGTRDLLAAASGRVGRWVQLSSAGVYGPIRSGIVTETSPAAPVGVYEVTKWKSEELVMAAARRGEIKAVVLRPSIIFAADMPNGSLRQMVDMLRRGWFFFIGRPGASANYVHVDDVVDALLLCAEKPEAIGQVFNLSGWTTMEAFVDALAQGLGRPAPMLRFPEALVFLMAALGSALPRFPLSRSRVLALTNRTQYSIHHISNKLGFSLREPIQASAAKIAAIWMAQ